MTIVVRGAAVVTVDAGDSVTYDGAVAIEADRIAAVGPSRDILTRYPGAERIYGRFITWEATACVSNPLPE
jgi:5-methylthioadenosine/S-adenosylhomocysteine deaminase